MQVIHDTRLSSTEIACLWTVYLSDSLSACLTKHLLQHNKTPDLRELLERTLKLSQIHMQHIKAIFDREQSLAWSPMATSSPMWHGRISVNFSRNACNPPANSTTSPST
jgi:hypothetical protein